MPSDFTALIKTFRDTSLPNSLRLPAVQKLQAEKDPAAVPVLIETLGDADWWNRCMAAETLGAIGDARAAEPLVKMVLESDHSTGEADSYPRALGMLGGDAGFDALVRILHNREYTYHFTMISTLVKYYPTRAFEPLVEAMEGPSYPLLRKTACVNLGWLGDKRALPLLIKALEEPEMRSSAAKALGYMKDPQAIAPLEAALKVSSEEDALNITRVLNALRGA